MRGKVSEIDVEASNYLKLGNRGQFPNAATMFTGIKMWHNEQIKPLILHVPKSLLMDKRTIKKTSA